MTERRVGMLVAAFGAGLFVVLAWWLVPWDPVPGGRLELPDPAALFTPAELAAAEHYSRWARMWGWGGLASTLVAAGWLVWSGRPRALAARIRGPWWLCVVVAGLASVALLRVVSLPWSVAGRVLRLRHGLSEQPWPGFARDQAVSLLLQGLVVCLVLLVLVGSARRWPRAWPAVAGLGLAALTLLGSFVYPVVVEPLFNSFQPLPDGPLRAQILELADREGVSVSDVLVADASRRTTTLNAYVSGFGGTRRVVLYDNLVADLPQDQTLSVVAHELAHARHDDVVAGSVLGMAGVLVGVGLLATLLTASGLRRRGVTSLASPAVVPVVVGLVTLGSFLAQPVTNTISRRVETRADVDALRATKDADAFVALQVELARRSLADPTPPPLAVWWFSSHPGVLTRIAVARELDQQSEPED